MSLSPPSVLLSRRPSVIARILVGAALAIPLALFTVPSRAQGPSGQGAGGRGGTLKVFDPQGRARDVGPPPDGAATGPESAASCTPPRKDEGSTARESRTNVLVVDPCGRIRSAADGSHVSRGEGSDVRASTAPVTIDRMTTWTYGGTYAPGGAYYLLTSAGTYFLSDGSQWQSGAGTFVSHWSEYVSVDVSGTTIRYSLSYPEVGLLYEQTDYDSGDHSAQGKLGYSSPLVLEAEAGSTTAVLRGNALVVSNDATWYGEPRFNYYSAVVGSVVPFEVTYTIQADTWTPDVFSRSFSYSGVGWVDFAHPVSTPRPVGLTLSGPPRVPAGFTTSYGATVLYENGITRDVTWKASWSVEPADVASITSGVLTTGALAVPSRLLTLRASYVEGADTLAAEKSVPCLAEDPAEKTDSWPMFQANARHTGYLPMRLDPSTFRLRWQRDVGSGAALNPVAAGEGKVFVSLLVYFGDVTSLFALNARDGSTLWSKGFGSVFSVNPPSFAWGMVYVQTGNHANDTWLHAFDARTGETVFKSPHDAQWERYFAPTLDDRKAYVDGGYYGGMYGFDAYTGARLWYTTLPQYDQWTPALDGGRAYAYVGDYTPGLYVRDSLTGVPVPYFVPDPGFLWNGWSMNLAPVVGAHGDVIAIHDGRLISFDPSVGSIRWQVQSQFSGQPSVAQDRIYAVDAGRLVVRDELTQSELWSWQPPGGGLAGPMIVTDTHLFASDGQTVYAVDLDTRESVWSYPVGGGLALADGTLYVASQNGMLTAIELKPSRAAFYAVTPCRVVDTRSASGVPVGGPALTAAQPRSLHIAGQCGVSPTAKAVSVNVAVTGPGAAGGLRLFAEGDPTPPGPVMSYSRGQTRANNAILSLSPAGNATALAAQDAGTTVHLVVDVNGYFE